MKLKLKLPNHKLKLDRVLWLIFLCIVIAEAWVLYRYLYVDVYRRQHSISFQQPATTTIKLGTYNSLLTWLKDRQNFILPSYKFQKDTFGRDNPFGEYK